jgi:hypothetical protein
MQQQLMHVAQKEISSCFEGTTQEKPEIIINKELSHTIFGIDLRKLP